MHALTHLAIDKRHERQETLAARFRTTPSTDYINGVADALELANAVIHAELMQAYDAEDGSSIATLKRVTDMLRSANPLSTFTGVC